MSPCDPTEPAKAPAVNLPEGVPALGTFYIYLSDNCNMRCRHCWIEPRFTNGLPDPGRCVDVDALRAAVVEARALGLRTAKLTGGEPMLHPRFIETAEMLTAEGLGLNMETNGTLLTAELARRLKEKTSLGFTSISLDGPDAKTHDAFRGVAGAFDAALRGLSYMKEAGFNNTQVIMSVHRGNRAQVEAVVRLAAERGASSVKLNPVNRAGRGAVMHERGEALNFDEHIELARYVHDELGPSVPVRVFLGLPPALSPLGQLWRTGGNCGDCGVAGILGILGTNEFALCGIGSTCPEFVYGKLGKDSVRDIWLTHPTILLLRRMLDGVDAYPGICGRCILAKVCRTGCVADNYSQNGQLITPNWLCAEADRRGLFPAARAQRRRAADKNSPALQSGQPSPLPGNTLP